MAALGSMPEQILVKALEFKSAEYQTDKMCMRLYITVKTLLPIYNTYANNDAVLLKLCQISVYRS